MLSESENQWNFAGPTRAFFEIRLKLSRVASLPGLVLALIFFFSSLSHTAPVSSTGMGWQTTLDRDDQTLTYSFDHTGGYSLAAAGISDPLTSLDTLFETTIPDWEDILKTSLEAWGLITTWIPIPSCTLLSQKTR